MLFGRASSLNWPKFTEIFPFDLYHVYFVGRNFSGKKFSRFHGKIGTIREIKFPGKVVSWTIREYKFPRKKLF